MKAKFQDEIEYTLSSFASAKAILKGRKEFLHLLFILKSIQQIWRLDLLHFDSSILEFQAWMLELVFIWIAEMLTGPRHSP